MTRHRLAWGLGQALQTAFHAPQCRPQLQSAAFAARWLQTTPGAQDISDEWFMRQRKNIILGDRTPITVPGIWIAPNAVIVGDVDLIDRVSVWYGCVLRGDLNNITVGSMTNIQDRTVIHAARTSPTGLTAATLIGKNVTIQPQCVLRSVRIEDNCMVGAKSVLLEGSMMEPNSILSPGSVLPPARRVPTGELWAGNPARFVRKLTAEEIANIPLIADDIRDTAWTHLAEDLPHGTAWRVVERVRAADIEAGKYQWVDLRTERYTTRVEAEKAAEAELVPQEATPAPEAAAAGKS